MGNELSSCQPCRAEDESAIEILVESDCQTPCDDICSQLNVDELGVVARSQGDYAAKLPVMNEAEGLWRCKSSMASEDDTVSTRSPHSSERDDLSSECSTLEAHPSPPATLHAEHKEAELAKAAAEEADRDDKREEEAEFEVQVGVSITLRQKKSTCQERRQRCRSSSSERIRCRLRSLSGMFTRNAKGNIVSASQAGDAAELPSANAAVLRLPHTPALDSAFGELPDPQAVFQSMRDKKPIFSKHIPGVSLSAVRDALEADGGCLHRYPCEALNCHGMSATTWENTVVGDMQHLMYKLAVPRDFPDFVYRMLGLPDVVDGATVSCISNSGCSATELVLLQRSRTEGVPYSDRLQAENVYCFQADANGHGVTMLQWTEVIWTQPCPWTMRPIAAVIEKKVKGEAKATAIDFQHILQDVIKRQNCADH